MNKQKIINNKKSYAFAELFIIMHHMFFKIMLHQPHSNIKTNIIKICTNISEKKVLNHDLNIHEVEVVTSESNANGNSKIKILIRI